MDKMVDLEKSRFNIEKLGLRKSAIFLISLGSDLASEVFKFLSPEDVDGLILEISNLGSITAEEKEKVLNEFRNLMKDQKFLTFGGIDFAKELLEKSLGKDKAYAVLDKLKQSMHPKPFAFMQKLDPAVLVNVIQQEDPQTIALILAHLEPLQASRILKQLPNFMQSTVTRRIATMQKISPDIIKAIELLLEKKLMHVKVEEYSLAGGVGNAAEIMNFLGKSNSSIILNNLEEEDPLLAEEIKKRMFVFEYIIEVTDLDLQKVLIKITKDDELVLALRGASPELKDKFFKNMSKNKSIMIKDLIAHSPPVKKKLVEEAQQNIVFLVKQLANEGVINIDSKSDEFI